MDKLAEELIEVYESVFKFASEKERLKTFKNWAFDVKPMQPPPLCTGIKLAKAGFYIADVTSNPNATAVRCFVCGKELDNWEPNDDPWTEHLSHAPKCLFVQLNKEQSDMTKSDLCQLRIEIETNSCIKYFEGVVKLLGTNYDNFKKDIRKAK